MRYKVSLIYKNVENEIAEEIVWVKKIGNYFKVDNIPFFAPNIALNDLIEVEIEDGKKYFNKIVKQSGHSTVQLIFFEEKDKNTIINKLEKLGCTWEGLANQKYIAIDISPKINYVAVKSFLDTLLIENVLDFKESCLSH